MGQQQTEWQRYRHWLTSRLASRALERWSPEEYRRFVRRYYDGPAGWFTLLSGVLTGHETLAYRIISPQGFDIRGCRRILDAGCGNGRYLRFLLRAAEPYAVLDGCDLSLGMLRRARQRLQSRRPILVAAALQHLPYRDDSFDAIVCGWVLEHLPDISAGLLELRRVLRPGGKLLLLTTEDTLLGALCSRLYASRTTSRRALRAIVEACGLSWYRELWWSRVHRRLGLGGIVVEVRKAASLPAVRAQRG